MTTNKHSLAYCIHGFCNTNELLLDLDGSKQMKSQFYLFRLSTGVPVHRRKPIVVSSYDFYKRLWPLRLPSLKWESESLQKQPAQFEHFAGSSLESY
jgi:hypothetical protein